MTIERCVVCDGSGIDPYDTDPLGHSMNTPCSRCDGKGITRASVVEIAKEKQAARIEDACDKAWESNWERR